MSYNLHLKFSEPARMRDFGRSLHDYGFHWEMPVIPDGPPNGKHAFVQASPDAGQTPSPTLLVEIPYGLEFVNVHLLLLKLEKLARMAAAKIIDPLAGSGQIDPAELSSVLAFHARYENACKSHQGFETTANEESHPCCFQ